MSLNVSKVVDIQSRHLLLQVRRWLYQVRIIRNQALWIMVQKRWHLRTPLKHVFGVRKWMTSYFKCAKNLETFAKGRFVDDAICLIGHFMVNVC